MEPIENHLPSDPSDSLRSPLDLPVWEYATPGPLRERLCGLTLAGRKTATFHIVDDETMTESGTRWAMVASDGSPLAVLEVTEITQMRFADVPWELADAEGESFVDVADWADGHGRFWNSIGITVHNDTIVQCERFRLVEVLPAAVGARYPVVEVVVPLSDIELASAELAELDTIGIEEVAVGFRTNNEAIPADHVMLRAGFRSYEAAATAEQELSQPWPRRFEVLVGDEWLDAWRDGFQSIQVGRVLVTPAWIPALPLPEQSDLIVIDFDPGRAWGTGAHESTKLALLLMQSLALTNATVFDAGCGSGILSVAAALLGARSVHGVDIDMASPAITHENAERNRVRHIVDSSNETVQSVAERHLATASGFDVVVANILAPVLIELAPSLMQLRRPNAPVVLAGLIDTQVERVVQAFAPLVCTRSESDGVWRGLVLNNAP